MRFGTPFEGLKALGPKARVIIDARVADLYEVPLASVLAAPSTLRIDATEPNKSLERMPAYVLHLLDHGGNGKCLAASRHPQQRLVRQSAGQALDQARDGLRLVAGGLVAGVQLKSAGRVGHP